LNRGFVKLYRKALENGWIKDHKLWVFWTWCLLKANHSFECKVTVDRQEVTLQPGQFIFGRRRAAEETGLSEQEVRTILNSLRKRKNLTSKSTNRYSIVSITNWDTYQGGVRKDQPVDQPAINQQLTTNKNIKKIKNNIPEEISSLLDRYPEPEIIHETLEAISFTRKTGRIADSVKLKILQLWNSYSVEQVIAGCGVYLDKQCYREGKGEKYLMGIIRNQDTAWEGKACFRSTGSPLLDAYLRGETENIGPVVKGDNGSN